MDIISITNDYNNIKETLSKADRDTQWNLVNEFRAIDFKELNSKQIDNVIEFLKVIDEDYKVICLTTLMDSIADKDTEYREAVKPILKAFLADVQMIAYLT